MAVTVNIPIENAITDGSLNPVTSNAVFDGLALKQDTLVSGTNIKTVGGVSILGAGDIAVSSGITIGTTPITSGTTRRVFFQDGSVVSQSANLVFDASNQLVIGGHTGGARLDVKAGGALSTDIVQRWRNSADSANLGKVAGDGAFTFGTYTNPNTRLSISGGSITGLYCSGLGTAAYFQNETGTGTGYAAQFLGRQYGSGSPSGYNSFGILTGADTINGVNYAIKAYAHNGTTNYAGYFDAVNGTTNIALYVQRGDMVFGVSPTLNKIGFWNATPIVQPTTAVASATLSSLGGTALTDTDTFDGYTIKQIVKALRNSGLLA
jgi:hypothetical protein